MSAAGYATPEPRVRRDKVARLWKDMLILSIDNFSLKMSTEGLPTNDFTEYAITHFGLIKLMLVVGDGVVKTTAPGIY